MSMAQGADNPTVRRARRIVSLRYTARCGGAVRDELAPVIAGMRDELAPTMPKRTAAAIIGISVPTLDKWIARGLVPTETVNGGRPRVLRDAVLELAERVEELRRKGQSRHLVAAAVDHLQREDDAYQREFEELYGPGLKALATGEKLVSAVPPEGFGPED
jgi:DNA-binding transcriptional MerR regulator